MSKPRFTPLRIRARLQCGVVSDPYLPIDAVLYYQMCREKFGAQEYTRPGESTLPKGASLKLPLKIRSPKWDNRAWYYAASFAQWPEYATEGTDYWNKRFDTSLAHLVDFRGRKARVDPSAGRYKSYHMPIFYRHALYVDWYVLGIRDEIERLLSTCTNLGKKVSQGWGAVLRWQVEDWPDDWSIRSDTGRLMRALPTQENGTLYGTRPSYWNPRHQFLCELP